MLHTWRLARALAGRGGASTAKGRGVEEPIVASPIDPEGVVGRVARHLAEQSGGEPAQGSGPAPWLKPEAVWLAFAELAFAAGGIFAGLSVGRGPWAWLLPLAGLAASALVGWIFRDTVPLAPLDARPPRGDSDLEFTRAV